MKLGAGEDVPNPDAPMAGAAAGAPNCEACVCVYVCMCVCAKKRCERRSVWRVGMGVCVGECLGGRK